MRMRGGEFTSLVGLCGDINWTIQLQVLHDEENDELSTYFKCEVRPKVLLTTSNKPTVVSIILSTQVILDTELPASKNAS